jgi:hypothetical protein
MCAANEGSPGSVGSVESGDEERGKQAHGNESKRSLTLLPLAALIFYEVSGGPFGIEVKRQSVQTFCSKPNQIKTYAGRASIPIGPPLVGPLYQMGHNW